MTPKDHWGLAAWAFVALAIVMVGVERSFPGVWSSPFGDTGWVPALTGVATLVGLGGTVFFLREQRRQETQSRELDQLGKAAELLASANLAVRRTGVYMLKGLAENGVFLVDEAQLALAAFAGSGDDNDEKRKLWTLLRAGTLKKIEPLHPGRAQLASLDAIQALAYLRPEHQVWWANEDERPDMRLPIDGVFAQSWTLQEGNLSRVAFTNFIADKVSLRRLCLAESNLDLWVQRPIRFERCDLRGAEIVAHSIDGKILAPETVFSFVLLDPSCMGLDSLKVNGLHLSDYNQSTGDGAQR